MKTAYYTVDGEIVGEATNGVRLDYLTDALGSVTAKVDQSVVTVSVARYKPYGERLSGNNYNFGWVGGWGYRTTSNCLYIRARHYLVSAGCWTSADSKWPVESPYVYVDSSPVQQIDPQGLAPCVDPDFCKPQAFTRHIKKEDKCIVHVDPKAPSKIRILVVYSRKMGCSASGKKSSSCDFAQQITWQQTCKGKVIARGTDNEMHLSIPCPGTDYGYDCLGFHDKKGQKTIRDNCTKEGSISKDKSEIDNCLPLVYSGTAKDFCVCGETTSVVEYQFKIAIDKGKGGKGYSCTIWSSD